MKLSKEVAAALVNGIRSAVEPEEVEAGGRTLSVYFLDDMNMAFTQDDNPTFYGISFEALGRDFTIINNLEVLIAGENDEGDEEGYVVEDELLMKLMEEFLLWRVKVIKDFGA